MTVDISSEAVDRFDPYISENWRGMMGVTAAMRATENGKYVRAEVYDAQAERIKELEAENAAGLRREKDANERAMKHLRRAEKAEITSKNHATFSHEWRERAEKAEAENGILRTEKHADAEAIASARNAALREAYQTIKANGGMNYTEGGYNKWRLRTNHELADLVLALIEGDTNDT